MRLTFSYRFNLLDFGFTPRFYRAFFLLPRRLCTIYMKFYVYSHTLQNFFRRYQFPNLSK
eukprot:snap_masked-scaffold_3-processed-gene-11.12-mRNA-1 protein AED:1.00 eAED:1.00 QI:0/0/0/0/1/1/2/0/59